MSTAEFIAVPILGAYFGSGFGLWLHVLSIRARIADKTALPHPLAFFGPSILSYAFSGRHRRAKDPTLSLLVLVFRWATLLLPLGIWAWAAQ